MVGLAGLAGLEGVCLNTSDGDGIMDSKRFANYYGIGLSELGPIGTI